MKLLEASDEDFEEEKQPTRSSSRLRHTARSSKRAAVIQSSSESDQESSTQGRNHYHLQTPAALATTAFSINIFFSTCSFSIN